MKNQPNWDDDDGNLDDDDVETEGDESAELDEDLDEDEIYPEEDEDNYDDDEDDDDDLVGHWSGEHLYGRDKEMSEFEDTYYSRNYETSSANTENIYTDDGDDFENV